MVDVLNFIEKEIMDALSKERFLQSDEVSFGANVSVVDGVEIDEGDFGFWDATSEQFVADLF